VIASICFTTRSASMVMVSGLLLVIVLTADRLLAAIAGRLLLATLQVKA